MFPKRALTGRQVDMRAFMAAAMSSAEVACRQDPPGASTVGSTGKATDRLASDGRWEKALGDLLQVLPPKMSASAPTAAQVGVDSPIRSHQPPRTVRLESSP